MVLVSTDKFHYHPEDRLFTQEISSLGKDFRFGQVYDDACDEGFVLISKKTEKEIILYVDRHDMNDDEIVGWWLKPTSESIKKVPEAQGIRVLVIND
jgi:hypothetical protein